MPNVIKYTIGSTETGCLRKGNMLVGNNTADYGSTFYSGITPGASGYTVYLNKATGGPSIYTPTSDANLVTLTNTQVAGSTSSPASYTTAAQCLVYYAGQTDKICVNRDYEGVVTNGLTSLLDAGFTPSYPTTGSSLYDLSGLGADISLSNTPAFTLGSPSYLSFNGSNQYGTGSTTNVLSASAYTKSVWFNLNSYVDNNLVSSEAGGHYMFLSGGNKIYSGNSNWAGFPSNFPSTATISLNTWYNATLTFNTTDGMKLYINGTLDSSYTAIKTAFTGNGSVNIGCYAAGGNLLNGKISQVMLYNRSISASEVSQNYNALKGRFGL